MQRSTIGVASRRRLPREPRTRPHTGRPLEVDVRAGSLLQEFRDANDPSGKRASRDGERDEMFHRYADEICAARREVDRDGYGHALPRDHDGAQGLWNEGADAAGYRRGAGARSRLA